jgi:ABC-type polysaccharide/polyol phosphate export permease
LAPGHDGGVNLLLPHRVDGTWKAWASAALYTLCAALWAFLVVFSLFHHPRDFNALWGSLACALFLVTARVWFVRARRPRTHINR